VAGQEHTTAMPQQPVGVYLRHGQTPFFRLPMADIERAGPAAYEGADAVLLGVPFDGGVTYQPGARLGPYHLRRTSALVGGHHPVHGIDVFGALDVRDGGNVVAPPFNAGAVRELIQAEVGHIADAGAAVVLAGGDHSISLPALRALQQRHGPLALCHIDAHFDSSTAEIWGERFHHGTPVRNAIEEELLAPGSLFQIGLRGGWKDEYDADFTRDFGGTMVAADEIDPQLIRGLGARIRDAFGDQPVYVSVDIDAIDPAFAPGTGTPVPGGLTSREILSLLRSVAGLRVVGFDVVEVAPNLDHADMTCHLGAQLLYEGLALIAVNRSR
jgi:agmatinase